MTEIARSTLPPDLADRWLSLMRPAAGLRRAEPGDTVAARLGGLPMLPDTAEWPQWPGEGPLSYIASVDCAEVRKIPLDIMLPDAGSLLFFYFDEQYGYSKTGVGFWAPESAPGARVLYVGPDERVTERACPEGIKPYKAVDLAAVQIMTWPDDGNPAFRAEAAPGQSEIFDYSDFGSQFWRTIQKRQRNRPVHWVGGYAEPIQGPVEVEAAQFKLGMNLGQAIFDVQAGVEGARDALDAMRITVYAEAANWAPLLTIGSDSDAGMMWGDVGDLYWLTRRDEIADGDPERTAFTWQCT